MPQVEVTFKIDANGILNVSAKDKSTGKQQSIEIKGSTGLSKEEVERMKRDAESHADEDRKRRELVDLRNQADQLVYQTRRQLEEHGDKVPSDARSRIESAASTLETRAKSDDAEAIRRGMDELNRAAQEMGKAVYEGMKAGPGAPQGDRPSDGDSSKGKGGKDDDVIDAEYEVKN
jgi:molecular chaperone DnaK